MRAVVVERNGGPDVLVPGEHPDPTPGPGQVLVRVAAAGVNFIDVYHREGRYPLATPFILGQEGAGTIAAVGPGVSGWSEGDQVAWVSEPGGYAELAVITAARALRVPAGVDLQAAAAVPLQGITAQYLATSTYPVSAGDDVLVHAAAGGVGRLLTQVVKLRGGRVIGTVSTPEKAEVARRAGVDEVVMYRDEDVAAKVRDLTGGRGVRAVFDGVGRDTFDASLAALGVRGMLVLFGAASGPVPPFDPLRLSSGGSLFLTRPFLAHYIAADAELHARAHDVFSWVADGSLKVHIGATYPLADARRAHEDLEARRTTGKVLLLP